MATLADEQTEKFVNEPVQRRWWLLRRAMKMTSLENALQLAAQAEAFRLVTSQHSGGKRIPIPIHSDTC